MCVRAFVCVCVRLVTPVMYVYVSLSVYMNVNVWHIYTCFHVCRALVCISRAKCAGVCVRDVLVCVCVCVICWCACVFVSCA